MKYLSLFFIIFLFNFCTNKSKSNPENIELIYEETIKFDIMQYNDTLSKKIPVYNNSKEIIEIYELISDCGCVSTQIDIQSKIQPNDSAYIHIKYIPREADDEGFVEKTISFRTSNESKPLNNIILLGYIEK